MKGLKEHLIKCEIEYIATHGGGCPESLKGLKGQEVIHFLRKVGFRIKEEFQIDADWVRTTNNISVSIASDCNPVNFVIKDVDRKERRM